MKNRFFILAIVVALVFAMAGVGTMAWFTSSATSTNNTFTAGTLKLGSPDSDSDGFDQIEEFAAIQFNNLQPGQASSIVDRTTIKNVGTLPLTIYRITVSNFVDNNSSNQKNDRKLKNALKVNITIGGDVVYDGLLKNLIERQGGYFDPITMAEGQTKEIVVTTYMRERAGNPYQQLNMSCSLNIHATQTNRPFAGQVGMNPHGLGNNSLFTAQAENISDNGEPWLKVTWDWNDTAEWLVSNKDEFKILIKHETDVHDAKVYEALLWFDQYGAIKKVKGLNESDVYFGEYMSDEIWIRRDALAFDGWETLSIQVEAVLNNKDTGKRTRKVIPYQQWHLDMN